MSTHSIPILKCSLADLFHEWIVSLCVILNISAILLPLAVLYGLKYGIISGLEQRLRTDPTSRELRPAASGFYSAQWLDRASRQSQVSFLVGMPRTISATVEVSLKGMKTDASIIPSGANDPYLVAAGIPFPKDGECAVSEQAASKTGVRKGDRIDIQVRRKGVAAIPEASQKLKVVGILPDSLCDYPAIYTQLSFAEAVEDYLDGFAVEKFGWIGKIPQARPVYDGAIVIAAKDKAEQSSSPADSDKFRLQIMNCLGSTGLTTIDEESSSLRMQLGLQNSPAKGWCFLSNVNSLVELEGIELLRSKIAPLGLIVIPWTKPRAAAISNGKASQSCNLLSWSKESRQAGLSPDVEIPEVAENSTWVLCNTDAPATNNATLSWHGVAGQLDINCEEVKTTKVPSGEIWVSAMMAGLMKRSTIRSVLYEKQTFVYTRRGYASFRMASKTLDGVLSLKKSLESQGIKVLTESQRIEDIRFLDKQTSLIFMIFSSIIGAGAITSLWAIAYSSAERKKRFLAFLQIMGATKVQAARFPLYQAIVLTTCGALLAWAGSEAFATLVNGAFAARLQPGEAVCFLPVKSVVTAYVVLIVISLTCYLMMIPRFIGMPLGEAARES